ncbi:dihydrolipoamide acetyltransferase family protein [Porticoccus sp. GXU_MW_L64]
MTDKINITLPAEQLEGTEATLSQWLVAVGDSVTKDQPVAELETDKVSIEIVAPTDGTMAELIATVGDNIEPDALMATLVSGQPSAIATEVVAATAADPALQAVAETPAPALENGSSRHLIGPAVRKLVAQHQLNFDSVPGTGRGGRVTRDDVVRYLASGKAEQDGKTAAPAASAHPAPKPGSQGIPSRLVPHSQMRKSIANHMVESLLHKAPHVTSVFEMDMSNIIEHRKWHKKEYADKGVKLTFTAYFLAACVEAMNAVPDMNAQFHDDALEIFDDINIGVGTALGEAGLVVPVVKRVQNMDLFEIARALDDQTQRARSGKLTPADMKGGTFTISNHGVSGSLFAAPIIINQPQVAILGIGKLEKRVEVVDVNGNDDIRIRPKCYVSLSIDHRAVDAFQTNAWLAKFVEVVVNWGQ